MRVCLKTFGGLLVRFESQHPMSRSVENNSQEQLKSELAAATETGEHHHKSKSQLQAGCSLRLIEHVLEGQGGLQGSLFPGDLSLVLRSSYGIRPPKSKGVLTVCVKSGEHFGFPFAIPFNEHKNGPQESARCYAGMLLQDQVAELQGEVAEMHLSCGLAR